MSNEVRGYSAVIAAAVLWGVGATVAKAMFNQDINPFLLAKMRLVLAFLLLAGGIFLYDRRLLVISRQDILYFAALGTFGMALCQVSYLYTIMLTSVATGVFLQYLAPVLMASHEVIWEKARLGRRRGGALFIATIGGLMIMLDSGGSGNINFLGIFIGLVSAVAFAVNTVYGRRSVRKYHPLTGVTYSFGFGALSCWLLMPEIPPFAEMTVGIWGMIVYITIFSTLVPFLLYFVGVRFLPPTNAGITACLEPVLAALAAYVALGEIMGSFQMLGGALVITAIILLQTAEKTKNATVQVPNERYGEG